VEEQEQELREARRIVESKDDELKAAERKADALKAEAEVRARAQSR
jgi:hypothetical protein